MNDSVLFSAPRWFSPEVRTLYQTPKAMSGYPLSLSQCRFPSVKKNRATQIPFPYVYACPRSNETPTRVSGLLHTNERPLNSRQKPFRSCFKVTCLVRVSLSSCPHNRSFRLRDGALALVRSLQLVPCRCHCRCASSSATPCPFRSRPPGRSHPR